MYPILFLLNKTITNGGHVVNLELVPLLSVQFEVVLLDVDWQVEGVPLLHPDIDVAHLRVFGVRFGHTSWEVEHNLLELDTLVELDANIFVGAVTIIESLPVIGSI